MSNLYGRYRFLRMRFGISSAPEIFQHAMHKVVESLEGIAIITEDILVWGQTKEEHDKNLENVLQQCRKQNLKLNSKKCCFFQDTVLAHMLTCDGLSSDPERLNDIIQVQAPSNKKELQTFLGMVNFVS